MDNGKYLKEMGAKLKAARNKIGMTLVQVSKHVGFHYSSISQIENGKHNAHILTIKAFADLYEVDVKDLL